MTVNQVRYVCETAKCGSMTRAAERFYISQPALSEQVRALEAELGTVLFRRTPRGAELTSSGAAFCQEAEPARLRAELRPSEEPSQPDIPDRLRPACPFQRSL